ncbi:hypothetical protein VTN31DRAFT_4298 [Thermomyces dupontii]|uniref:uncharacterized protein n=1 Tax=Talaromyces thermophilus TaxID=28565 RepID=UPI003742D787
MSDQAILRISREIRQLQQSSDLSLAVVCEEADIRDVKALIIGPPGTPYEYGFFEFSVKFTADYPARPPNVRALTTNNGRCRFNPNIYADGKVCLSILGTWHGERGEEWSSAQGLESILLSIQSLMSANPYENEPGYENVRSEHDKIQMERYKSKIQHETLRIAVIQPLEDSLGIQPDGTVLPPPERVESSNDDNFSFGDDAANPGPFDDLRKRRFMWYYESYLQTIEKASQNVQPKQQFERMNFEGPGNVMSGCFDYPELKRRLVFIKDALAEETASWAIQGQEAAQKDSRVAVDLRRQYERVSEDLKQQNAYTVDLDLVDGNVFVWVLTYFGRPMTHLDGGVFRIKIHLSPKFPQEQPRVFVQTPIFHHRVSKEGVLCYFPRRPEDLGHHIEAMVQAIEEEEPPYDPRAIVNPEASKLLWGSPEDKKKYFRALRRSVERSIEEAFD